MHKALINITSFFNRHIFFLILYGLLVSFFLAPYYRDGALILGGEADYVLNFSLHLQKYSLTWYHDYGLGIMNFSPSGAGLNVLALSVIEKIFTNLQITNFILIFAIYFLPFLAMFLVCKIIKISPLPSFLYALFYVINPLTLNYFTSLNQWCVFSITVIPLFLWIFLKFYADRFKLFFFFGLTSVSFSFAYTNYPTLAIILISTLISMFIASYYWEGKFIPSKFFFRCCLIFVSFVSFNLWWILPLYSILPNTSQVYTVSFARSMISSLPGNYENIFAKTLALTSAIPINPDFNFFTFWYNLKILRVITYIPLIIIVSSFIFTRKVKLLNIFLLAALFISLFLAKGNGEPAGFIYEFLFKNFPLFYIFKSPIEKFGLLYIYIFSLLLMFSFNDSLKSNIKKLLFFGLIVYLGFCSVPLITGNIIPDYKVGNDIYASRKYVDKEEYRWLRAQLISDPTLYRVLSFPGGANYQVCLKNFNDKRYTGLDPVVINTDKAFLGTYNAPSVLYKNISSDSYARILGLYNVKKVIINKDVCPWFGLIEKENTEELKSIFSSFMKVTNSGSITLMGN